MPLPGKGWSNNRAVSEADCPATSWKQHWLNYVITGWPKTCGVSGCNSPATLVAHVNHPDVAGDRVVPMCSCCYNSNQQYSFKTEIALVSAKTVKAKYH